MRRFGILFWTILIPALAAFLVSVIRKEPGLVMISGPIPFLGERTIYLTFLGAIVFGIGGFFSLYFILRFFSRLIRTPESIGHFNRRRRAKSADREFARAQLAIYENRPKDAEKLFMSAAKKSDFPSICYIGAAKASHMLGDNAQRDRYLSEIDYLDDKINEDLSLVVRGDFLIEIGEFEKAEQVLTRLVKEDRGNAKATLLLAKAYHGLGKFEELIKRLPDIQKAIRKASTPCEERGLYCDILEYAAKDLDVKRIKETWWQFPNEIKRDHASMIKYAHLLLDAGDPDSAEALLRGELRKSWDENMMMAYSQLYRGNIHQLIKQSRNFVKTHEESAIARYALANFLVRNNELAEAEEVLMAAIKLDPTLAPAHKLFGELKLRQNDPAAALQSFQCVNDLLLSDRPAHVKKADGELLVDETVKLPETIAEVIDGEVADDADNNKEANPSEDAPKA